MAWDDKIKPTTQGGATTRRPQARRCLQFSSGRELIFSGGTMVLLILELPDTVHFDTACQFAPIAPRRERLGPPQDQDQDRAPYPVRVQPNASSVAWPQNAKPQGSVFCSDGGTKRAEREKSARAGRRGAGGRASARGAGVRAGSSGGLATWLAIASARHRSCPR